MFALTNEEITLLKQAEGKKIVLKNQFEDGKNEEKISIVLNCNRKGYSNDVISDL